MNKAAIGAGAAAAVAGGILFYTMRYRGVYQGCVSPDGKTLTREKDGKKFQLTGQSLARGENVSFKAKKDKDDSTGNTLEVESLGKDKGPCEQRQASAAGAEHP